MSSADWGRAVLLNGTKSFAPATGLSSGSVTRPERTYVVVGFALSDAGAFAAGVLAGAAGRCSCGGSAAMGPVEGTSPKPRAAVPANNSSATTDRLATPRAATPSASRATAGGAVPLTVASTASARRGGAAPAG